VPLKPLQEVRSMRLPQTTATLHAWRRRKIMSNSRHRYDDGY